MAGNHPQAPPFGRSVVVSHEPAAVGPAAIDTQPGNPGQEQAAGRDPPVEPSAVDVLQVHITIGVDTQSPERKLPASRNEIRQPGRDRQDLQRTRYSGNRNQGNTGKPAQH